MSVRSTRILLLPNNRVAIDIKLAPPDHISPQPVMHDTLPAVASVAASPAAPAPVPSVTSTRSKRAATRTAGLKAAPAACPPADNGDGMPDWLREAESALISIPAAASALPAPTGPAGRPAAAKAKAGVQRAMASADASNDNGTPTWLRKAESERSAPAPDARSQRNVGSRQASSAVLAAAARAPDARGRTARAEVGVYKTPGRARAEAESAARAEVEAAARAERERQRAAVEAAARAEKAALKAAAEKAAAEAKKKAAHAAELAAKADALAKAKMAEELSRAKEAAKAKAAERAKVEAEACQPESNRGHCVSWSRTGGTASAGVEPEALRQLTSNRRRTGLQVPPGAALANHRLST